MSKLYIMFPWTIILYSLFSNNLQVGLKQGVEMLNIFKSYAEKMSLFDDFSFYENREKALRAKRSLKPATLKMESIYNDDFTVRALSYPFCHWTVFFKYSFSKIFVLYPFELQKLDRKVEGVETDHSVSLITLTNNLSLNSSAWRIADMCRLFYSLVSQHN